MFVTCGAEVNKFRTMCLFRHIIKMFAVAVVIAPRNGVRKVRTAKGTVVANSDAQQCDGKCNRKKPPAVLRDAGKGEMVR